MIRKRVALSVAAAGAFFSGVLFFIPNWTLVGFGARPISMLAMRADQHAEEAFVANAPFIQTSQFGIPNTIDESFDFPSYMKTNDLYEYSASFVGVFNMSLAEAVKSEVIKSKHQRELIRGALRGAFDGYDSLKKLQVYSEIDQVKKSISYTSSYIQEYFGEVIELAINAVTGMFLALFAYGVWLFGAASFRRWMAWVSADNKSK